MKESSFESVGGIKIATRSWQPEGTPRAVMILVHGFNAHSGYMIWPGEQFSSKGFATYALDLRGRGKSEGERFYIDPTVCPRLNEIRRELGLPDVRRVTDWWHSPEGVVCTFPDWFAAVQSTHEIAVERRLGREEALRGGGAPAAAIQAGLFDARALRDASRTADHEAHRRQDHDRYARALEESRILHLECAVEALLIVWR